MGQHYLHYLQEISGRYFMIAGIFFFLYYVLLRKRFFAKKLQKKWPNLEDYVREVSFSMLTMCIFAFVPLFILHVPFIAKHSTYYTQIETYGWWYFFLAFPLMFFMHDMYFYWMHRLMHHKKLFNAFHLVHHRSTNPSPWAAYAFHPLEALIEAGIFPVFLFTLPIHRLHLFIFFFLMIVYNVYGHLGFEIYSKGFRKHWLGKWINTSVNHNQHHQYFRGNYGLYFTFWDRWMGTLRKEHHQQNKEVTGKKKKEWA